MPRDRLRSPRAGQGRKTTSLSDFEYRVWDQAQLSADDFGVLRLAPMKVQADNEALAKRAKPEIQRALQRLVTVGLYLEFEHQGLRYLCDPTWQDFQHVKYAGTTLLPKPGDRVLARCSPATQALFAKHPGGARKGSENDQEMIRQRSEKDLPTPRAREMATANADLISDHDQPPGSESDPVGKLFARFWLAYPKVRRVAKVRAEHVFRRLRPSAALLDVMLAALIIDARSPQWTKDGGQFIPHPATWLNQRRWEDEREALAVSINDAHLDAGVVSLCRAAGLREYDIETWFVDVLLSPPVGIATGQPRVLTVPSEEAAIWIRKHYRAMLAEKACSPVVVASPSAPLGDVPRETISGGGAR